MRLTFLGTGSAMPTGHRNQSGTLVVDGDDALLVDCGSGVLDALARSDVGYEAVDAVVLTHHHLDHVADLLPLLKARWLAGADPLTVGGPPGTETLLEDLLSVHGYLRGKVEYAVQDPTAGGPIAGFAIESMETRHSVRCFAYRVTPADAGNPSGGVVDSPTVVLSGDTEAFPELAAFADGATILVHDCSFPDDVDVSNHPTPSSLGAALADAAPAIDRVYLSHLYPHTEGRHEEMLASIDERYDGDVAFAEDGLTLELGPRRAE